MTAQGLLNRYRAEANRLPPPTMVGEWTISPGGVRFRVVSCTDGDERPRLAWEVVADVIPPRFF